MSIILHGIYSDIISYVNDLGSKHPIDQSTLKRLSRNLGDVKVEEILFESFEGKLVNWILGTKIICIRYDVRINARQNNIHLSSNLQNSAFQYPDHEEF